MGPKGPPNQQSVDQGGAPLGKRSPGVVVVAEGEQVERDEGRGRVFGEHPHPRIGRVDALLQRLEVQAVVGGDDDLTVDHTPLRQLGLGRRDQFGKVAGHRPLVAAAQLDLIGVAEADGPEPVPFRLIGRIGRDRRNRLGQHRRDRRHHGQVHGFIVAGGMLESGCGRCSRRTRRRRDRGSADQPGQGVFPQTGSQRNETHARRVLPRGRSRADAHRAARPANPSAALPRRHRRRGDLPEAHSAAPSRLSGDVPGHVSVRADGRRAEGDPSRVHRVGGADGHRHTASLAGALPGYRAPRRVAHRPGSAARHRLSRRPGRSPSTYCGRCSTNSDWSATRRRPGAAASTCSCGSKRIGISSRCAAPASRWRARWSAARRMR